MHVSIECQGEPHLALTCALIEEGGVVHVIVEGAGPKRQVCVVAVGIVVCERGLIMLMVDEAGLR